MGTWVDEEVLAPKNEKNEKGNEKGSSLTTLSSAKTTAPGVIGLTNKSAKGTYQSSALNMPAIESTIITIEKVAEFETSPVCCRC